MKTKILALMFVSVLIGSSFAQTGIINNGAKIIVTTGAIVNITGGNFGDFTNATSGLNHGSVDLDGTIKLTGDWTNNATSGTVFVNGDTDGEVQFVGTTAQVIAGNQTDFEKLTVDNALGLSLSSSTNVNGNLGLTSGKITLGSNNLTLGSTSTIVGTPSVAKMIVTDGSGELRKNFTTTGSFEFPVGDATSAAEYSPIMLDFTSGTFGSGAYAAVKLADAKHAQNTTTGSYITRYWSLNQSNISSYSCNATATYQTADVEGTEEDMFGAYWNGTQWVKSSAVTTATNLVSATLTSLSDLTAGDQAMFCTATIVIDEVLTNVNCNGENNGEINTSVSNGFGTISYNWTTADGSGLNATDEDQTALTAGNYNVTVTDQNGCTQNELMTLTEPTLLTIIMSQTPTDLSNNGTATASVSGGTSPYDYLWDDAATQTTETATGLSNQLYNVVVTDDHGCIASNSITVDFTVGMSNFVNNVKITAYPNPVIENLNISIISNENKTIEMNVYDEIGKLIETRNIDTNKGENLFNVNTSNYSTGTYFINLKSDKTQQIVKFVKVQ